MSRRLLGALALTGVATLLACREDPAPAGELVLVVTSDLAPPKDFDTLHLEVARDGVAYHAADYTLDRDPTFRLPATLTIAESSAGEVRVRLVGLRKGVAVVAREARTNVPAARTAALRLDLSWLCLHEGVSGAGDQASARCPSAEQTCRAGACVDSTVPEAQLPDYAPQQVFGGADGPGSGGCFETVACFAQGTIASGVRMASGECSIDRPVASGSPEVGVNVALASDLSSEGICAANGCLVALDQDPDTGWIEREGRLLLPSAACRSGRSIVVSTACTSKRPSLPTCGPWSATVPGSGSGAQTQLPFPIGGAGGSGDAGGSTGGAGGSSAGAAGASGSGGAAMGSPKP